MDVSSNEIGDDSGIHDMGFSSHKGRSWKMRFGPFDCMYGKRMIQPDVCDILYHMYFYRISSEILTPCSMPSRVPHLFFFGKSMLMPTI